jgi:hypothetical protein
MIDRQQFLRPVYGVGGVFHVETPVAAHVISSACSRSLCFAKTNFALLSGGFVTPAPPGIAMIAIDTAGATIYFPSTQQFGRWQNGALTMLDLSVNGTVVSLGSGSSGLMTAVERSGVIWIVSADGLILDSLPQGAETALLTAGGIVYSTSTALILRRGDGSELSFPVSGVSTLLALGDGYVEARAGSVIYALRTIASREQLFQLPQPPSEQEHNGKGLDSWGVR